MLADVDTREGATWRHLDVSDAAAFDALAEEIGPVDLLINCAGITLGGATHEMSSEHWDRIIDVNIRGRGALPGLCGTFTGCLKR